MASSLYLIPNILNEDNNTGYLDERLREKIGNLRLFVVENEKNARRLLKKISPTIKQDELDILILDKNDSNLSHDIISSAFAKKTDVGLITDAGTPCVADPGSLAVEMAHKEGFRVIPLVGPNSIILALMASGFNGQSFAFHGYLPVDDKERIKKLRLLEEESAKRNMTQLFIETPYRNNKMIEAIISQLQPATRFCFACDLTAPTETIISQTIAKWKSKKHDFHKRPAVFVIYAGK